jgi:electron transport complex protein RnfE
MSQYRDIVHNSLWKQNAGLVQLLGLCPLLAMSNSVVNAAGLGLATVLVMTIASLGVSVLRSFIPYEIRIPVFILIIAALVTMVDFAMNAWVHELYIVLGIFIPLIVTNCIVLARVEAFAAKNGAAASALDGAMMGLGLTLLLVVLGAIRELVGQGTLFAGIDMVFPGAAAWQVLPADYPRGHVPDGGLDRERHVRTLPSGATGTGSASAVDSRNAASAATARSPASSQT